MVMMIKILIDVTIFLSVHDGKKILARSEISPSKVELENCYFKVLKYKPSIQFYSETLI